MIRALPLAAILASAVAGCAAPAYQANPAEKIRTTITETPAGFDLAADRGKTIYIEFLASPTATAALRRELEAAGLQLAASRELASVSYDIDGAYQALRPATGRTAEVRAGVYVEQPGPVATKTGRGASVMLSLNPLTMLLGTVFSNAGDRTGARDATNTATVGDPDGKCLAKCEGWIYHQRAVIQLTRTENVSTKQISTLSTADEQRLIPQRLFQSSLDALLSRAGMKASQIFKE